MTKVEIIAKALVLLAAVGGALGVVVGCLWLVLLKLEGPSVLVAISLILLVVAFVATEFICNIYDKDEED